MISKIKKPVSILLSLIMVFSLFTIVPLSVSAAGEYVAESDYLKFTAQQANSSVTINFASGSLSYKKNNASNWTSYTSGTTINLNNGEYVRFKGKDTKISNNNNGVNHVVITGKVAASGNIMSLRLNDDGTSQGLTSYCFHRMFDFCTGLTSAPRLPETTLAEHCYSEMFRYCSSLTTAPELPATNLAEYCYYGMFDGCTSLTEVPALPATTLAAGCYWYMFDDCESLTTPPALPATTLPWRCYLGMFQRCIGIKLSATQTIEYSIPYTVPAGGGGTDGGDALYYMFAYTGGTFKGTPEINKTYYLYKEVPKYTVTWKNGNTVLETDTDVFETTTPTYNGTTPVKPDSLPDTYVFSGWTDGTTTYGLADTLPPVSGDVTYTAVFAEGRTVTWKNGDTTLETDIAAEGATPTYNGATPTKSSDVFGEYTFSGWTDGTNTYAANALPASFGDVTYTAVYTSRAKLFTGHTISLNGYIDLNFYVNVTAAQVTEGEGTTVNFTWTVNSTEKSDQYKIKTTDFVEGRGYKATVRLPAAEMSYSIHATATINGVLQDETSDYIARTSDYSVREYALDILENTSDKKLITLVKRMLDYGAKAQVAFDRTDVALANKDVDYKMAALDSAKFTPMIEEAISSCAANEGKTTSVMKGTPGDEYGVRFYATSLVYLSGCSLRQYYTVCDAGSFVNNPSYSSFNNSKAPYYYLESGSIPAAELDELQEFTIGESTVYYSALDFAKLVIENTEKGSANYNLAAATYWYNQAANAYFDPASAPAVNFVDLSTLTGAYEAQDGDVLTGELGGDYKITIAADATVTLNDVTITCLSGNANFAGITPLGDATIILKGTNVVKGGYKFNPCILAAPNHTLTIDGSGSLDASSNGWSCGIGGGYYVSAGNIVINGGTITATGGDMAAGIGGGAAASCGDITIADTVTSVTATKGGGYASYSIGKGLSGSCGTVTIGGEVGAITQSPYTYAPN